MRGNARFARNERRVHRVEHAAYLIERFFVGVALFIGVRCELVAKIGEALRSMREAYVGVVSEATPTYDLVHCVPAIKGKAFVGAQEAGCFVGRFFAIDVERLVQIDDALSCQQGLEEEFVIRPTCAGVFDEMDVFLGKEVSPVERRPNGRVVAQ